MRPIIFLHLSVALILTACNAIATQAAASPYFDVDNDFRDFYISKGGSAVLGPVISPSLIDNGFKVQYFQNARLEYHRDSPSNRRVVLSPLGLMFSDVARCIKPEEVPSNALYFGCHSVREEVLIFFNKYGGIQFFGYPLSELYITEDQQLVQNFERAFIIWDKSKLAGSRFGLANLGQRDCEAKCSFLLGSFSSRSTQTSPQSSGTDSADVLAGKIKLRSELEYPILPVKTHKQELKIWARDNKTGAPLPDVSVAVVIMIPGQVITYILPPTNALGYTSLSFTLEPTIGSGEVIYYTVKGAPDEITISTSGSFLAWTSP